MRTPREITRSLDDFAAWSKGNVDFDMIDYAMCVGTPDLWCLLFELADPELTMHEGEYFLAHRFDSARYDEWRGKLGSSQEVQRVMNHLDVSSLIQGQHVSDPMAVFIAEGLARLWNRALGEKGLVAEAYGTGLDDAQVTFFRREP